MVLKIIIASLIVSITSILRSKLSRIISTESILRSITNAHSAILIHGSAPKKK